MINLSNTADGYANLTVNICYSYSYSNGTECAYYMYYCVIHKRILIMCEHLTRAAAIFLENVSLRWVLDKAIVNA